MDENRSEKHVRRKHASQRRQLDTSQSSDDLGLPSLNPPQRSARGKSNSAQTSSGLSEAPQSSTKSRRSTRRQTSTTQTSSDLLDAPQNSTRRQDRTIPDVTSDLSQIQTPIPPLDARGIPLSIRKSAHNRQERRRSGHDEKPKSLHMRNQTKQIYNPDDPAEGEDKPDSTLPLPPWLHKLRANDATKAPDKLIVDEKLEDKLNSTKTLTGTNFGKCDIEIEPAIGTSTNHATSKTGRVGASTSRKLESDAKQNFKAGDRRPGAYEIHRRAPGYLPAWFRRTSVTPEAPLSADVEVWQASTGREDEIEEIELPFRWGLCIGLAGCLLVTLGTIIAVVVIVTSGGGGGGGDAETPENAPPTQPPAAFSCEFTGITQPDPFQQCECNGSIEILSESVKRRYKELQKRFILSVLPGFVNPGINSCRPENVSLVWLAIDTETKQADWTVMRNRYILSLIYALWNGNKWKESSLWLSSEPECNWFGVSCIRSVLTELILPENNLHGVIPSEIGLLTGMRVVDFSNNFLEGTIPEELYEATDLEQIILWTNRLEGTLSDRIGSLANLRVLGIEQNMFTGTLPESMSSMNRIKWFLLDGNNFEGPVFDKVLHWPEIEAVELRSNSFDGTLPSELGSLSKLRILDFSYTNIKGTIPTTLADISSLEYLVADGHQLRGTIPTEIGKLDKLSHFAILTGGLEGNIPSEIGSLALLESLILAANNLSGSLPSEIGRCASLRVIDVGRTRMSGTLPSTIRNLSHLRTLKIDGTDMRGSVKEICELRDFSLTTFWIPCRTEMGCMKNGCCIPQCS